MLASVTGWPATGIEPEGVVVGFDGAAVAVAATDVGVNVATEVAAGATVEVATGVTVAGSAGVGVAVEDATAVAVSTGVDVAVEGGVATGAEVTVVVAKRWSEGADAVGTELHPTRRIMHPTTVATTSSLIRVILLAIGTCVCPH